MRLLKQTTLALSACLFIASQAFAGEVTIPNAFTAGETAVAADVNANFTEVKTAVDDNNARIITNENTLNALVEKRVISFPAASLSHDTTTISAVSAGLLWKHTYSGGTNLHIKAPIDYAGGDVTFRITFSTTTDVSGEAGFFIRPNSYNSGEVIGQASVSGVATPVNGKWTYEQSLVIPASMLQKSWWRISMQNDSSNTTYEDDLIVHGVVLEYSTK